MQERLRPLFCPMELNIKSDILPFDDRKPAVRVPSAFFVDPRLAMAEIVVQRDHYDVALRTTNSHLPKMPGRLDADHGWLTPVKARSDVVAIDSLIERGVVSKDFAMAVLAVDFTNPVFSKTRCGLLQLVPDKAGSDFLVRFQSALRNAGTPRATALHENLTDPARNAAFFEGQARAFLAACQRRTTEAAAVTEWYQLLAQRRAEVAASEISQNPSGRILEDPGRIVFPSTRPAAVPRRLALTPACRVE